jgi:hypothetical protein
MPLCKLFFGRPKRSRRSGQCDPFAGYGHFDPGSGRHPVGVFERNSLHGRRKLYLSLPCRQFTKKAQATGPENIDPERPLPGLLAQWPVLSLSRITLEYNEKIRPQPDQENAFARSSGG